MTHSLRMSHRARRFAAIVCALMVCCVMVVMPGASAFAAPLHPGTDTAASDASTTTDPTWERIQATKTLRVGMEGTFKPYGFHDDSGNLVGIEVDIARQLADILGVKVEFVETKWDSLIAGLGSGRYDVILNNITATPERRAAYDFSIPYLRDQGRVAVRKGVEVTSLADVKGKRAAQTPTSNFGKAIADLGAEIVPIEGFAQAAELLNSGRADVTANSLITFVTYLKEHPDANFTLLPEPLGEPSLASVMMPKGSPRLAAAITAALQKMMDDGALTKIYTTWVGEDLTPTAAEIAHAAPEASAVSNRSQLAIAWKALPELLGATLKVTIPLSVISFLLALVIASVAVAARLSRFAIARAIAFLYVWIFRGTPLLVQLFIVFFGLPRLGLTLDAWTAAIITFSLNTGAYAAEAIRGGVASIPKGQYEAARVLGLSPWAMTRHVVAPQALRIATPALGNDFIDLFKGSSLVSTITLADVFLRGQQIVATNFEPLTIYLVVAAIYLVIVSILTWLQSRIERASSRHLVTA